MTVNSSTVFERQSPPFLLRALYFVLCGLWLSGIWAVTAWVFSVTIIGLPVGLWMLDRLPQVTTLKARSTHYAVDSAGHVVEMRVPQHPFLLRAVYFVLIGWWLSALWLSVAWALSASIIGLPFSFWMINRTAAVLTLSKS